jgi:hypothetical protein
VAGGAVAFAVGNTKKRDTFIEGKLDAIIENVECVTITLVLPGTLTATGIALGDISTAEVCVLDGTGKVIIPNVSERGNVTRCQMPM